MVQYEVRDKTNIAAAAAAGMLTCLTASSTEGITDSEMSLYYSS